MAKKGPLRLMTPEKKNYLCEQIAAGRSVIDIVKDPQMLVSQQLVNLELRRDSAFLSEYARAREYSIEPKIEENEAILRGEGDWKKVDWEIRKEIVNERRWNAIRLQRFRYGDKIDFDVNATVKHVEGKVIDVEALDYDQLVAFRQALQIASGAKNDDEEYEYADYEEVDESEDESPSED
jgi:hypothetical protein